jgi:hypothetical protein
MEFKAGIIRADVKIGDERRVMVLETSDVEMRLRKLLSDQRLGRGMGIIRKMADKYHLKNVVFEDAGRCNVGGEGGLAERLRGDLEASGFRVYRWGRGSRGFVVYEERHYVWIEEGVKAVCRGVSLERLALLLRVEGEREVREREFRDGSGCGVFE